MPVILRSFLAHTTRGRGRVEAALQLWLAVILVILTRVSFADVSTTYFGRVSPSFLTPNKHCSTTNEMANKTFNTLTFDNTVLNRLPVDSETDNFRRQVSGACYSYVKTAHVLNPRLMAYAESAMRLIDLDRAEVESVKNVVYLSGNQLMKGSVMAAHCYCGHQFGVFAGQLGDGAAIYLGEVVNSHGDRWEIQLKGAGPTPFSRSADGRKVVRSSIREFLCSEAMHHLGVATTRAGSVVTSDSTVVRDIFYTGNPIKENCAVVLRLAPTFLRFGSFEIFKPADPMSGMEGPSVGQKELLRKMLDYTAEKFYPEIWSRHSGDHETIYVEMFKEIVKRTAKLVAHWQCVGWVHGVLNTDNLSIIGLTIDYGPFGFMDAHNPDYVSNTSDDRRRYSYKEQPSICRWNCERLAEAWGDVVPVEATKKVVEEVYDVEFKRVYQDLLHKKFGLFTDLPGDSKLFEDFFSTMVKTSADFTNSFRSLSRLPSPDSPTFDSQLAEVEGYLTTQCKSIEELTEDNKPMISDAQLQMLAMMARSDPRMLAMFPGGAELLAQEMDRLETANEMKSMTEETKMVKNRELWHAWMAQYMERLKLECAGKTDNVNAQRVAVMNSNNPRVVLRNYLAQNAIVAAEQGHYAELKKLLRVLEHPFDENVDLSDLDTDTEYPSEDCSGASCAWKTYRRIADYTAKPPSWTRHIRVSCSS